MVHRVRHLTASEGSIYIKLHLIESIAPGRSHRVRQTKRRTALQRSASNAVFEDTLTYLMAPHELKMRRLETTVCCRVMGKSSVVARCIVSLEPVQALVRDEENPTWTEWHPLHF